MRDVVAITGAGGMGMACARRLGFGRHLVLADYDTNLIETAAADLTRDGYSVTTLKLDVADEAAVASFAGLVESAGPLRILIHTAGRTPRNTSADQIYAINLLGACYVCDAFLPLARPGTAAITVSSTAGHIASLSKEVERRLALDPPDRLMDAVRTIDGWSDPFQAYGIAKRMIQLRAEADAAAWGARGGRIISISPGVIATAMNRIESEKYAIINEIGLTAPVGRVGTAEDIAATIEWLTSPLASFITGCDLRIDGGLTAAQRWGNSSVGPMERRSHK